MNRSLRLAILLAGAVTAAAAADLGLDGRWEMTVDGGAAASVTVPGLAGDPAKMASGTLRYRRTIHLPGGDWNLATLRLGGARFEPVVYVDGEREGESEGGMAPIEMALPGPRMAPGRTVSLEIDLKSLRDVRAGDASNVPAADRWRSDVSSGLWDDVSLHLSRDVRIARVVPWTDLSRDAVLVRWRVEGRRPCRVRAEVLDLDGRLLARSVESECSSGEGASAISLHGTCRPWNPDSPRLYRLRVVAEAAGRELDRYECNWAPKEFRTKGLLFELDGRPIRLRGASVVWHRWLRDPEASAVAWKTEWFERNVVRRLKERGANFLRFHLGLPPERLLDLCDRDGLLVQMEWPFFHGVKADAASMSAQWRDWLEVAMRHPCVAIVQPWNETEGGELAAAWGAFNPVLAGFPALVVAHRDEIPIHKYWWSLFENLGLYYDSAAQFGRPVMVDEFGGDYLDACGNIGAYPAARESYLRFLGRDSTKKRRLAFQAEASARVAEYWRRLGVAGIAPFCTLSSPEDGNTWFLGPLAHPRPKPVWDALTAAYAPQSVSLEIWDRNFAPGQPIAVPVYLFNDTPVARRLDATVRIATVAGTRRILAEQVLDDFVPAWGKRVLQTALRAPSETGEWRLEAELTDSVPGVTRSIVSSWNFRTLDVAAPPNLLAASVGISPDETELSALLAQNGIRRTSLEDPRARALVLSAAGWRRLKGSPGLRQTLQTAVRRGQSVLLLDAGPRELGAGYKPLDPAQLEGAPRIAAPRVETVNLFRGVGITFREAPEPESHCHPALGDDSLWRGLPRESTWLWNGLRGGLVVPAEEMEVRGLAVSALTALWVGRGASERAMHGGGGYFAYRLAGSYAFSSRPDDPSATARLRARAKQMADDAPALQDRINPNAPVEVIDLGGMSRPGAAAGEAPVLLPLASCGKNLSRTPVVELRFARGQGTVIISQLLTAGRLRRGEAEPGLYGIRYDPAAEQFTLNLISRAVAGADSR